MAGRASQGGAGLRQAHSIGSKRLTTHLQLAATARLNTRVSLLESWRSIPVVCYYIPYSDDLALRTPTLSWLGLLISPSHILKSCANVSLTIISTPY